VELEALPKLAVPEISVYAEPDIREERPQSIIANELKGY
jgi:hypothetical protein